MYSSASSASGATPVVDSSSEAQYFWQSLLPYNVSSVLTNHPLIFIHLFHLLICSPQKGVLLEVLVKKYEEVYGRLEDVDKICFTAIFGQERPSNYK